jgi:hypothetical protein
VGFALPKTSVPTEGIPDYEGAVAETFMDPELQILLKTQDRDEMGYIIKP